MPDQPIDGQNPAPEPELSIADHEAQFSRVSERHTTPEPTEGTPPADDEGTEPPPAAAGDRDERGRFRPRAVARSHQAGKEDTGRIAELTRKLRTAERDRDEWKTKASAAPAPREDAPRETPPPATEHPPAPVRRAALVKPTPTDTKDDGSAKFATYEDYLDARDEYNREIGRQDRAQEVERDRLTADWTSRTEAARDKYDDFEQVALLKPTRIPAGSIVDAFILEDEAGADVLYHFQKNDAELDRVLAMAPFKAVKFLSLLSQRLADPDSAPTRARIPAATGPERAAPHQPVTRPPTPVRTVPAARADEPPGDDASLAEHERAYGQRQRRH